VRAKVNVDTLNVALLDGNPGFIGKVKEMGATENGFTQELHNTVTNQPLAVAEEFIENHPDIVKNYGKVSNVSKRRIDIFEEKVREKNPNGGNESRRGR